MEISYEMNKCFEDNKLSSYFTYEWIYQLQKCNKVSKSAYLWKKKIKIYQENWGSNKDKRDATQKQKKICVPPPGVEPGPAGWEPAILTARPWGRGMRIGCKLYIYFCTKKCHFYMYLFKQILFNNV